MNSFKLHLIQMNNRCNVSLVYLRLSKPSSLYHQWNDLSNGWIFEMFGEYLHFAAASSVLMWRTTWDKPVPLLDRWNRLFQNVNIKTAVCRALLNGCKEKPTCSLYIKPLQAFHAWCLQGILEIRCKSIVETVQTEQPRLHCISHVMLTQEQHNPIWPALP